MNHLEVAAEGGITRSQGSAPAASFSGAGGDSDASVNAAYGYGSTREDFAILTHGQGYPTYAAVVFDDKVLHPGMPVQVGSTGEVRYATPYVTDTEVRVETWCSIGQNVLPSASIAYQALAFRDPRGPSGNSRLKGDASTGVVTAGRGRFANNRKYVQIVDGGSPFVMPKGRAGDADNGAARLIDGDGGVTDTVPSGTKQKIVTTFDPGDSTSAQTTPSSFGADMVYGGSFASPSLLSLQVPDDPPGGPSGLQFDPVSGVLKFRYQGRDTLTNSGKLVALLSEQTLTPTVSFPTFTTNTNYSWGWYTRQLDPIPFESDYYYDRWGTAWLAAIPQETESTTVLATVPTGADFVCGLVKINRTSAPDDWFASDPIEVLPKQNVWIPFMGSFTAILEAAFGMVRMVSIYIEGGQLKLWQKQSVANAPGGFSGWDFSNGAAGWTMHIEHYGNGNAGIPVRMIWNSSTRKRTYGGPVGPFSVPATTLHKWDGANPPSPPATPDFASSYGFTIDLRFGRSS
jgi:hypothetical protein